MQSLGDLNTALPPNEREAEHLQSVFRQAALSITALFKQGKKASSKAYIAGQRQAMQEVLELLQALLDQPAAHQPGTSGPAPLSAGGPVDVGRLINFICARQEALKAEEEDNEEEDPSGPSSAPPLRRAQSAAPTPVSPLRAGMAFPRSTSATGPPRPASAAPTASSSRLGANAVASTSSAPASPPSSAFSPPYVRPPTSAPLFSFSSSTATSGAPPQQSTAPASPSPLSHAHAAHNPSALFHHSASGPPSPLARSHGRGTLHRSRTSSRGGSRAVSGAATPVSIAAGESGAGGADGAGEGAYEGFEVGMKRRWIGGAAAGAAAPDEEVIELRSEAHDGADSAAGGGMDVEPMADLDGWDGIGERPLKRVTRTARGAFGGRGGGTEHGGGGGGAGADGQQQH
ncbi:hypothetical protein Rhopal_004798-T1 [Rhodotorula paludigena]|uniref:Uncharacterized protein n=1 Tax=Rhodotorula paludigena TaxID=86838 RepID=A0AAV5GGU0_9BASI|nr:hypothetical protein Rhopal_004798-T1 [Rhodotorula paludigena]